MSTADAGLDLLRDARSVLLIDWPARDVPDSLALAGLNVVAEEGPNVYRAYRAGTGGIEVSDLDERPAQVDIVYAFRPLDELPAIVAQARAVGARAVWLQSGLNTAGERDLSGCWLADDQAAKTRQLVASAGLEYVQQPYIADAARAVAGKEAAG
jgi:hypothetical protein